MAGDLVTSPGDFLQKAAPSLAGLGMSIPTMRAATVGSSGMPSGLGDLTISEVNQIQAIVNQAGRPLEVVVSAARGVRNAEAISTIWPLLATSRIFEDWRRASRALTRSMELPRVSGIPI
jgi:hypothetical protein